METDLNKKIDEYIAKIEELKNGNFGADNEVIHLEYDAAVSVLASSAYPELMAKLRKAVDDIDFWYA